MKDGAQLMKKAHKKTNSKKKIMLKTENRYNKKCKKKEQKAILHSFSSLFFLHSSITPRNLVCIFFKCAKGGD